MPRQTLATSPPPLKKLGDQEGDSQSVSPSAVPTTKKTAIADDVDSPATETVVSPTDIPSPGSVVEPVESSSDTEAITLLVTASDLPDAAELVDAAAEDVVTVSYYSGDSLDTILEKITTSLDGKKADSVGFASHSLGSGTLHLADQVDVELDTLAANPDLASFWQSIGSLTKESGSIDLMGCDIAAGEKGREFINKLEEISGRDVAASDDATGNGDNADWELEEGGVQLIGKYFDGEKIGKYSGEMEGSSITLDGKTLYDTDDDNYYEIDSAEKLIALSQDASGWRDKNYELTADIDFGSDHTTVDWNGDGVIDSDDEKGFSPIGENFDNAFSGHFNGNSHVISNLYIDSSEGGYIGLFGYYQGGRLENVGLTDVNTKGTPDLWTSVGGLIGLAEPSSVSLSVSNCYVSGDVSGHGNVGGLIGTVGYSSASLSVSNCYFSGNISGEEDGNLGGLIGWANNLDTVASLDVNNCYASGIVTGGDNANLGGLIGWARSGNDSSLSVTDCYAQGDSIGKISEEDGGKVTISSPATKEQVISHLLAQRDDNGNPVWTNKNGTLEDPVLVGEPTLIVNPGMSWDGDNEIESAKELIWLSQHSDLWNQDYELTTDIDFGADHTTVDWNGDGVIDSDDEKGFSPIGTGTKNDDGTTSLDPFTGSFLGNNHRISNLYFNDTVHHGGLFGYVNGGTFSQIGLENVYIKGDKDVGGLFGSVLAEISFSPVTITNCYVTGHIFGSDSVGGLIGTAISSTHASSSVTLTVSNCYTACSVEGDNRVGGLIGDIFSSPAFHGSVDFSTSYVNLDNCYSTGTVSGRYQTGRLIGQAFASGSAFLTVNNYYSDIESIGRVIEQNGGKVTVSSPATKEQVISHLLAQRDDNGNPIWTNKNGTLEDPVFGSDPSSIINHAPTLSTATLSVTDTVGGGILVSDLLVQAGAADSDNNPLGIAIAEIDDKALGTWQYSTDNGNSWQTLSTGNANEAFLLNSTDMVRFLKAQGSGRDDVNLVFHAWDGTEGIAQTLVALTSTGGETAYSTSTTDVTAEIVQDPVPVTNHAPTINSGNFLLSEEFRTPSGIAVSDLFADEAFVEKFAASDQDGDILGLAISKIIVNNGSIYYGKLVNGAIDWEKIDPSSCTKQTALLLAPTDFLRFIGQDEGTGVISFKVWDGTNGVAHGFADTTNSGSETAFSAKTVNLFTSPGQSSPPPEENGTSTVNNNIISNGNNDTPEDSGNEVIDHVEFNPDPSGDSTKQRGLYDLGEKYRGKNDVDALLDDYLIQLAEYDLLGANINYNSDNVYWVALKKGIGFYEEQQARNVMLDFNRKLNAQNSDGIINEYEESLLNKTKEALQAIKPIAEKFRDKILVEELSDVELDQIANDLYEELFGDTKTSVAYKYGIYDKNILINNGNSIGWKLLKEILGYNGENIYAKGLIDKLNVIVRNHPEVNETIDELMYRKKRVGGLNRTDTMSRQELYELYGILPPLSDKDPEDSRITANFRSGTVSAYDSSNSGHDYQCVLLVTSIFKALGFSGNRIGSSVGYDTYLNVSDDRIGERLVFNDAIDADSATSFPHKGAVISFTDGKAEPVGHVAIVRDIKVASDGRSATVKLFEQNIRPGTDEDGNYVKRSFTLRFDSDGTERGITGHADEREWDNSRKVWTTNNNPVYEVVGWANPNSN